MKDKDINSLEHTTWRCQYHIVFAPKFRRQAIYREIKVDIGKILRQLCQQKGIEIIEAELCPDHIHMHACEYPSEVQRVPGNGVSEREEQSDDLRQAREFKVQVWEPALLGERILRGHGRKEQKASPGVHQEPIKRGRAGGSDEH